MSFFSVLNREVKKDVYEVYPNFEVKKNNDLMTRGRKFYALWDAETGMWTQSEYRLIELVDNAVWNARKELQAAHPDAVVKAKTMVNFQSKVWTEFTNYIKGLPENFVPLDSNLTFANTPLGKKSDYISKRLPYELSRGDYSAWDELVGKLYSPSERQKIEWAIGSVVAGDAKKIQKFIVLYGEGGKGKGTIITILDKLFQGYTTAFNAKALTSNSNQFATEAFKGNPLVAFQHDGDLSRIEDNTQLNSIVSHEPMVINAKYESPYTATPICMLFLGTNSPVRITDAKSGVIRRLIDIEPTGDTFDGVKYEMLMDRISMQLGAIAQHCLDVYRKLGKHYYDKYRSLKMMYKTDIFFNFVEESYTVFKEQDSTTLKAAYAMYKEYCEENGSTGSVMMRIKFREELKNYFKEFYPITRVDGKQVRSYFKGFKFEKIDDGPEVEKIEKEQKEAVPQWLVLDQTESLFDEEFKDCPAQYVKDEKTGQLYNTWPKCTKTLKDIDTKRLHHVKGPENLISIDFDIPGKDGKKDPERNIEEANKWPPTYAEYSKSGGGIHLEYWYDGDVSKLAFQVKEHVEIKNNLGGSSLRRKLSLCNNLPIAHISSGLPLKEEKVIDFTTIEDEKHLIALIEKNLKKKIVPSTHQSVGLIAKDLEAFYKSGKHYDVRSYKKKIMEFAANSSNHSPECLKIVTTMKFHSDDITDPKEVGEEDEITNDERLAFFDVEVFPNLFLINWKFAGDQVCKRMINPTPQDLEEFIHLKLVGFNCRRYDNHIVYARYLGKTNQEIYDLSKRIINGDPDAFFGKAYDLSYTDVYDFCSKKQSLKKWEIELDIHHQELGLPWDQPVDESLWSKVAEYCDNDVIATEAVFNARQDDWKARKILARMAGLNVNATTNQLTQKIIFGWEKKPQGAFNYRFMGTVEDCETYSLPWDDDKEFTLFGPDWKPVFPGYTFENGKSMYRGEEVGEGGYVYAEPGMYWNIALLDIASMHPSSIVAEDLFGPEYTKRFHDILNARLLIKHREWDEARKILDGKLEPFLEGMEKLSEKEQKEEADNLSGALKIAINSVYGLTSAKFTNAFRDIRNKDNIVAKRGALFMINLKHLVQAKGFTVAHIKTDSIKIPNATPEIIQYVMDYGKLYGYTFEHESTYDRMCLVNNAVYVAHVESGKHAGEWNTTGAQFAEPYVKKTLFTREPIEFKDLCQTKTVTTNMYLDMNESLPEGQHDYHFVGKAGSFCPIRPGCGGGWLMRQKDDKYDAVTGTKDQRWLEAETVKNLGMESSIDRSYFDRLVDEAVHDISEYGDIEVFRNLDGGEDNGHDQERAAG